MVTFANMDKFDSTVAENRISQLIYDVPKQDVQVGDSVFVREQWWTIVDFWSLTQSVVLRRGKLWIVADIEELDE